MIRRFKMLITLNEIIWGLLLCFNYGRFSVAQKQPHFQGNRTTMVHLFEWTWPAIAKECEDFLGPHGYGGVQISPPNECRIILQPSRPWWERYQPLSYRLHSRSGNELQLREMIRRCNQSGVRIYVDAVINHMTGAQSGETLGTAGSRAHYENRQYPAVPYGPDDFNTPCSIENYQDPIQVRNCQLSSLLDLNQGKTYVRDMIVKFMNQLIELGVAGFRIDAAKHMWPADLKEIYGKLSDLKQEFGFSKGARPFIYQEVIDLGAETIKNTEYSGSGCVTEFKHSNELGRVFRGKTELKYLRNWGTEWGLLPSSDALVFIDNHDNQRGHGAGGADVLTHKDSDLYRMALAFMLAHPYGGVARVMSSYRFSSTDQGPPASTSGDISSPTYLPNGQCNTESTGWICEHRWPSIANMVEFRNIVGSAPLTLWWDNGHKQLAFARAGLGFIVINMERNQMLQQTLHTGLPPGEYRDILSVDNLIVTVNKTGYVTLALPKGPRAVVLHVRGKL